MTWRFTWHKKFAWRPVIVEGKLVWWRCYERRAYYRWGTAYLYRRRLARTEQAKQIAELQKRLDAYEDVCAGMSSNEDIIRIAELQAENERLRGKLGDIEHAAKLLQQSNAERYRKAGKMIMAQLEKENTDETK